MGYRLIRPCCTASSGVHPKSCACAAFHEVISQCVTKKTGPDGPALIIMRSESEEKPAPVSILLLIDALNEGGDNLSARLLANLADELNDAECADQALTVSQFARHMTRVTDFNTLSRTYHIEAEAYRILGNRELALNSHDIATHLSSAARLRRDMGDLPAQIRIEASQ